MEHIEITFQQDEQGRPTPISFIWKGRRHLVESTGRRWEDAAGLHILVLTTTGRGFELIFIPAEGHWFIGRAGYSRMKA